MKEIVSLLNQHPTIWEVIKLTLTTVLTIVVVVLLLRAEKKLSGRFLKGKKNMNARFVESVGRFVLILLAVEWVVMSSPLTQPFGKVLFQGTTVIAAIAGFAAQPVIADIICGLMMSGTRPFDIGDRIELEDGTAGIVKDITMRHVVLQLIDTAQLIIPNSKLNSMRITNMSSQTQFRSIHFRFNVAYGTDIDEARAVIAKAVEESPCSVPGKPGKQGGEYGPVYFIQYAESSLVMAVTVYYESSHTTESVKDDINTRVKRALEQNGIEIPYNYVNVVVSDRERKGNP